MHKAVGSRNPWWSVHKKGVINFKMIDEQRKSDNSLALAVCIVSLVLLIIPIFNYFVMDSRKIDLWNHDLRSEVWVKFGLVRQGVDEASFPSVVYTNNTVIYNGGEIPPSDSPDIPPDKNWFVHCANGRWSMPEADGKKLLSWTIARPVYDASVKPYIPEDVWDRSLQRQTPAKCHIYLQRHGKLPMYGRLMLHRSDEPVDQVIHPAVRQIEISSERIAANAGIRMADIDPQRFQAWEDKGVIRMIVVSQPESPERGLWETWFSNPSQPVDVKETLVFASHVPVIPME